LNVYRLLLIAQHRGDYDEYIELLLSEKGYTVTGGPSPEGAAKFAGRILKAQSRNSQAAEAADRGFSLERKGKFIEAAQEYSAATTLVDQKSLPGYLISVQLALIKEVKSRVIRVVKDPNKFKWIKPDIKSDVPVYGPYRERDYVEKVTNFSQRFSNIPGVQEVVNTAMHEDWKIRSGGAFQIKAAEAIGPEQIRAFEERHRLSDKSVQRVDIATKKDVAVECKSFTFQTPRIWDVQAWVGQAVNRLRADIKGHRYHSVLIVIPDGKNIEQIQAVLHQATRVQAREFSGKIELTQLKDVLTALAKMKKGWW